MGFLNRLLNRPPGRDQFANLLLKRIRQSGDQRPIEYNAEKFQFRRNQSQISFLGNVYQEYLRCEPGEREQLIRNFLAMWHTTELPVPEDFDLVKADLLPALRARSFFEVDMRAASSNGDYDGLYETVGEHLALALAYDLPTSMMIVNEAAVEKWGVSFYEAMEVARQNLAEKSFQIAQVGSLYSVVNGDGYDATRLVLLDFVQKLEVAGDVVAMVPNRERLHVTGSDDVAGLQAMLHFASEDLQHERFISGIAFRLEGDQWEPWLPPKQHACFQAFHELALQTTGQMYNEQAKLFNRTYEETGDGIFHASFSAVTDKTSGETRSYSLWAQDVHALLPETDDIILARPKENGDKIDIVARCDWDTVREIVGHLMEPQEVYPKRWRVGEFPTSEMLEQIEANARPL